MQPSEGEDFQVEGPRDERSYRERRAWADQMMDRVIHLFFGSLLAAVAAYFLVVWGWISPWMYLR